MPKFVRILAVALLAVFAAGSVVHATSTTTMAVKMALGDGGTMDMADCTDCDAGGDGGGVSDTPPSPPVTASSARRARRVLERCS